MQRSICAPACGVPLVYRWCTCVPRPPARDRAPTSGEIAAAALQGCERGQSRRLGGSTRGPRAPVPCAAARARCSAAVKPPSGPTAIVQVSAAVASSGATASGSSKRAGDESGKRILQRRMHRDLRNAVAAALRARATATSCQCARRRARRSPSSRTTLVGGNDQQARDAEFGELLDDPVELLARHQRLHEGDRQGDSRSTASKAVALLRFGRQLQVPRVLAAAAVEEHQRAIAQPEHAQRMVRDAFRQSHRAEGEGRVDVERGALMNGQSAAKKTRPRPGH